MEDLSLLLLKANSSPCVVDTILSHLSRTSLLRISPCPPIPSISPFLLNHSHCCMKMLFILHLKKKSSSAIYSISASPPTIHFSTLPPRKLLKSCPHLITPLPYFPFNLQHLSPCSLSLLLQ